MTNIISSWFKRYWDIELSESERKLLREGVKELETNGIIKHDESQRGRDFIVLTGVGKEAVETQRNPDSHAKKYY